MTDIETIANLIRISTDRYIGQPITQSTILNLETMIKKVIVDLITAKKIQRAIYNIKLKDLDGLYYLEEGFQNHIWTTQDGNKITICLPFKPHTKGEFNDKSELDTDIDNNTTYSLW